MKKTKKHYKTVIGNYKSPYGKFNDDIEYIYQKYKNDPKRIKIIDGKKYYKIMESFCLRLRGRKPTLIVYVNKDISLELGDKVIDNYGHKFTFKGMPFIRFGNGMPEWYLRKVVIIELSDDFKIGEYIRKFEFEEVASVDFTDCSEP